VFPTANVIGGLVFQVSNRINGTASSRAASMARLRAARLRRAAGLPPRPFAFSRSPLGESTRASWRVVRGKRRSGVEEKKPPHPPAFALRAMTGTLSHEGEGNFACSSA
jgi:hypothetical protein